MIGYQQGRVELTPQLLCKRRGRREEKREEKQGGHISLKITLYKRPLMEDTEIMSSS